jgi:hypothetical protein
MDFFTLINFSSIVTFSSLSTFFLFFLETSCSEQTNHYYCQQKKKVESADAKQQMEAADHFY